MASPHAIKQSRNYLSLFLFLLINLGFHLPASALENSGIQADSGQEVAKTYTFSNYSPADQLIPSFEVIDSATGQLMLEFLLPGLTATTRELGGDIYQQLTIDGGDYSGHVGEPMLPTFSRLLELPASKGVTIEINAVETTTISNIKPMPNQSSVTDAFIIDHDAYQDATSFSSDFSNDQTIAIGDPAIARGVRVAPISIHPVRFDPATYTIHVAKRIRISVNFNSSDIRNNPVRDNIPLTRSFSQLFQSLVVNFDNSHLDHSNSLGSYLIICPDDTAVISALEPLVEWRIRKGYDVTLTTLSETGSTALEIRDWLIQAYENWDDPPEFITLVGDAGGPIALPTFIEGISGFNGEGDHPYTCLTGTDNIPDAHIGRISVSSINQLEIYVHKIVSYESTPYIAETDWFTSACLVGDPYFSGISCVHAMEWLAGRLDEWHYTTIDTIINFPFLTRIVTSLNIGRSIFFYRGIFGMSDFTPGHIENLQNGSMLPFAINLTCDTGSFAHGTSASEAWIRAGASPRLLAGGIASIGTATSGTHTRYNNCMGYGIWRAPFWENTFQFGACLTRGKFELYSNYSETDPLALIQYLYWNNLMGDPAGELWTATPKQMSVDHPATLASGANTLPVTVTIDGLPAVNAYVCLWPNNQATVGGYTDENGQIEITFCGGMTDSLKLTVTKHNHYPYLATVDCSTIARYAGYQNYAIDDNNDGASSGNGDGFCNPNETIELPISVRNFDTAPMNSVTGVISSADPFIAIVSGTASYGDIEPGATAWSSPGFIIAISPSAPNNHLFQLVLDLYSGDENWHSTLQIPVNAVDLLFDELVTYGFGQTIDLGETGHLVVALHNQGSMPATNLSAVLISEVGCFEIHDDTAHYDNIAAGEMGSNDSERFYVEVHHGCLRGQLVPLSLVLSYSDGIVDTVHFTVSLDQSTTSDPTGPDSYGYYAFDNSDIDFPEAPVYDWVEIDPDYGGAGETVGLTDFGLAQDDSRTLPLPFPFKYYGAWYNELTICSNGWLAMGETSLTLYRNWNIPCAGAPENLIAPFWDNLIQDGDNQVYHWFDESNHRYIIQWSRLDHLDYNSLFNFEVILYDPAYESTVTGDGSIVFQYETFNNPDIVNHYSTTGIQNIDRTDGLMYGYFNQYNGGAAPITSGTAIKFLPYHHGSRGILSGIVTNQTFANQPLPDTEISAIEFTQSFRSNEAGLYEGSLRTGTYTIIATHPSFAPDTVQAVNITLNEATDLNFSLIDNAAPIFHDTTVYRSTSDTAGPYIISTTLEEYSDLVEISLIYNIANTGWHEVPMNSDGSNQYSSAIPGADYTSQIQYYLASEDNGGNAATDPPNSPNEVYTFWVLPPQFVDNCESGEGNWTHYPVTPEFADQWHLSDQNNHTDSGTYSWKFGGGQYEFYDPYADGALVSEVVFVDDIVTLSFWHMIDAEDSANNHQAYDGGIVELSLDGGEWTQINTTPGYNRVVRIRAQGPGPFPVGIGLFSGTFSWRREEVIINEPGHYLQFRFHFGSDYAVGGLGWYIDDVMLLADSPRFASKVDNEPVPKQLMLYQSSPNPFPISGHGTLLRFDLPAQTPVSLRIIDSTGRLVKSLVDDTLPAGVHRYYWNGLDKQARQVSSGVYFYILGADGSQESKQMIVVR